MSPNKAFLALLAAWRGEGQVAVTPGPGADSRKNAKIAKEDRGPRRQKR